MKKAHLFTEGILENLPSGRIFIDETVQKNGSDWIDITWRGRKLTVEVRPVEGFGFYSSRAGYGEGPRTIKESVDSAVKFAVAKLKKKRYKQNKKS
jgi:hypothetical protein